MFFRTCELGDLEILLSRFNREDISSRQNGAVKKSLKLNVGKNCTATQWGECCFVGNVALGESIALGECRFRDSVALGEISLEANVALQFTTMIVVSGLSWQY